MIGVVLRCLGYQSNMAGYTTNAERLQLVSHETIIRVGEAIHKEYDQAAEDEKQRAIRCTEEVVRREERTRREQQLATAREEWSKERTHLLEVAHSQQQIAVTREKSLLETRLRDEFTCALEKLMKSHEQEIKQTIQDTWKKANEEKEQAVAMARHEEKQLAANQARIMAEQVARDKQTAAMEANQDKKQALRDQETHFHCWHEEQQGKLTHQLESDFEDKMDSTVKEHRNKMATMQQMLQEERARSQLLVEELRAMTAQRDNWEQQHSELKNEFARFIDQFPGFKAEFIL